MALLYYQKSIFFSKLNWNDSIIKLFHLIFLCSIAWKQTKVFFFLLSFEVFIDHNNIDIGVTVISIIYNKINQVTIIINQQ